MILDGGVEPRASNYSAPKISPDELQLIANLALSTCGPTRASSEAVNAAGKTCDGHHEEQDTSGLEQGLTSVNPYLSRLTCVPFETASDKFAINCTADLTASVSGYVAESLAPATRSGYLSDLTRFRTWGGSIPASEVVVASYIAGHAQTHAAATLARWLASISKAHRASSAVDPTKSELVKATLRGIRRTHGVAQDQATALLREDLFMVLDGMDDDLKAARDRALLLLGFAGGFRRSELVGLDVSDIEHVRQGIVAVIRRSKTDQLGEGRRVGVPLGRTRNCPVAALDNWLEQSGIETGPIFRPVNRHGQVRDWRLSGEAVAIVIKARVTAVGLDPDGYSGHSLRAGFATSAAQAGVSSWKIRAQTGHKSEAMLARYIREGELFTDNAAGSLL